MRARCVVCTSALQHRTVVVLACRELRHLSNSASVWRQCHERIFGDAPPPDWSAATVRRLCRRSELKAARWLEAHPQVRGGEVGGGPLHLPAVNTLQLAGFRQHAKKQLVSTLHALYLLFIIVPAPVHTTRRLRWVQPAQVPCKWMSPRWSVLMGGCSGCGAMPRAGGLQHSRDIQVGFIVKQCGGADRHCT
jgi:hypothetical protein